MYNTVIVTIFVNVRCLTPGRRRLDMHFRRPSVAIRGPRRVRCWVERRCSSRGDGGRLFSPCIFAVVNDDVSSASDNLFLVSFVYGDRESSRARARTPAPARGARAPRVGRGMSTNNKSVLHPRVPYHPRVPPLPPPRSYPQHHYPPPLAQRSCRRSILYAFHPIVLSRFYPRSSLAK